MELHDEYWLINRRRVLKWLIRLGYGAFALAFALPALALRSLSQQKAEIALGDKLVYATNAGGFSSGMPVRADGIAVGQGIQAFPDGKAENQNNLIEIVRLEEGTGEQALVAYSAICTHLGCVVYANLNDKQDIACPCHNSQFNPAEDAAVVGGPANRPLPSLPVSVNSDGVLEVAGMFSAAVGPD